MPQAVYDYEQLHRDRLATRRARVAAERKQIELLRLESGLAALRVELALIKLQRALHRKDWREQPRVPEGNPDGGQWTSEGGSQLLGPQLASRLPVRPGGATLRIGRNAYPATSAQAVRWSVADAQADVFIREVRRYDPSWRPSPNVRSDDAEGWIRLRESQAEEAAARLRELGVEPPAPLRQERALRPGGRLIGWHEGRASVRIRTCTREDFRSLLEEVSPGAQQVPSPPDYEGLWYRQPNGSVFGLRWSDRYALTYDVIRNDHPIIRRGFKVHQK